MKTKLTAVAVLGGTAWWLVGRRPSRTTLGQLIAANRPMRGLPSIQRRAAKRCDLGGGIAGTVRDADGRPLAAVDLRPDFRIAQPVYDQ
jgi:hypothetical protein